MFRRGVRTIAWCLLFIACLALIRDLTGPATLELAASSEPSRVILQSTSIGSAAAQADLKQLFGPFDFVDPSSSFIGKLVLSAPLWLVAGLLGAVGLWLCPSAMRRVPATTTPIVTTRSW